MVIMNALSKNCLKCMILPVRRSLGRAYHPPSIPGIPEQEMPTRNFPPAGHQSKRFHPLFLLVRGWGKASIFCDTKTKPEITKELSILARLR
jgi:hypothetical protein